MNSNPYFFPNCKPNVLNLVRLLWQLLPFIKRSLEFFFPQKNLLACFKAGSHFISSWSGLFQSLLFHLPIFHTLPSFETINNKLFTSSSTFLMNEIGLDVDSFLFEGIAFPSPPKAGEWWKHPQSLRLSSNGSFPLKPLYHQCLQSSLPLWSYKFLY